MATTIDIDEATRNADPLRRIVENRVEELLRWRTWYRMHRSINLAPIEQLHNAELRALVRLLRAARLQEKADTVWHAPDPIDLAKAANEQGYLGYHDWSAR